MLSIDYLTNIIFVPKTYTQFVSTDPQTGLEIRQMNLTTFAQDVADLQDDPEGAWASTAFQYTAPVNVGGVQLAPVVVILSPYTVEFEDAQYAVNLVGANTNVQDVAVVNQVSIRPNNSAGLTFSQEVQLLSFQNASVWIDTNDGQAGTQYPKGSVSDRVNNSTDAITIAARIGYNKFQLEGSTALTGVLTVERYKFIGNSQTSAIITATNLDVTDAAFERCGVIGSVTGRGSYQDCSLGKTVGLTGLEGIIDNSALAGDITLDALATESIVFKDCISTVAGTSRPTLNCNGTAAGINFRRYAGGLAVTNFSNAAGAMTLDLMGADVSIDSTTCTDGEIVVRGVGRVTDENGVLIAQGDSVINGSLSIRNITVNSEQVSGGGGLTQTQVAQAVWNAAVADYNAVASFGEEVQATKGLTPTQATQLQTIFDKLPPGVGDILPSEAQVLNGASPWTSGAVIDIDNKVDAIVARLPAGVDLIASQPEVLAIDSPWSTVQRDEVLAELDAIVAKLPTTGLIANATEALTYSGPFSSLDRDQIVQDTAAVVAKLPINGAEIAGEDDVAAIGSSLWTQPQIDQVTTDTSAIAAKLPVDNIAGSAEVAAASSPFSALEADAVIADTAAVAALLPASGLIAGQVDITNLNDPFSASDRNEIMAELDSIVAKLPTGVDPVLDVIASLRDVQDETVWTSLEVTSVLADLTTITGLLPAGTIASSAEISALNDPFTPADATTILTELNAIFLKLPTGTIADATDVNVASPWSVGEKDAIIADVTQIQGLLPVTGIMASSVDISNLNDAWTSIQRDEVLADLDAIIAKLPAGTIADAADVTAVAPVWSVGEKDALISELDNTKRQALKAANNTESPI